MRDLVASTVGAVEIQQLKEKQELKVAWVPFHQLVDKPHSEPRHSGDPSTPFTGTVVLGVGLMQAGAGNLFFAKDIYNIILGPKLSA